MARTLRFAGWSLLTLVALTFTYTAVVMAQGAGAEAKPKYTIKEVMKAAHTPPGKALLNKVLGGDASPEEKQKLLDLYISLAENKPPKGSEEAWEKKTGNVVIAAAMVVVGRENGVEALKKATVCADCHKEFKPPAK